MLRDKIVLGKKLIVNLGNMFVRSKLSEMKFALLLLSLILYELYLYDFSLVEYGILN